MREPEFWNDPDSVAGALLGPLGCAYAAVVAARFRRAAEWWSPVPVLCVGNAVMGGAGKTPVALDIGARLAAKGRNVHFLSRGYGGRYQGPVSVDPDRHLAEDVGDEPLLLARVAPTWVSRDRRAGCVAAAKSGAGAIVMDDGFQNPNLCKTLSLLVVDGERGFGNGRVFPAGPLREPASCALARADAVVLLGENRRDLDFGDLPVIRGRIVPGPDTAALRGQRVLAFAGLGHPEKFFATLRAVGCVIAERRTFDDHHLYSRSDTDAIAKAAHHIGAVPITTEKDAVRLPEDLRAAVKVLTIGIEWDDEAGLETLVLSKLFP